MNQRVHQNDQDMITWENLSAILDIGHDGHDFVVGIMGDSEPTRKAYFELKTIADEVRSCALKGNGTRAMSPPSRAPKDNYVALIVKVRFADK